MRKNDRRQITDYSYTQNRELSWLEFNRRVLEEADDETVPPLERLNYAAIFSENLDEFFMVRIGSLYERLQRDPDTPDHKSGLTPRGQLQRIYDTLPSLLREKERVCAQVWKNLMRYGISEPDLTTLSDTERQFVHDYCKRRLLPLLTPQISDGVSSVLPEGQTPCVAAFLRRADGSAAVGLVPLPPSVPKLLPLPGAPGRFIRTETLLLRCADGLFRTFHTEETCLIRMTRSAKPPAAADPFSEPCLDFRERAARTVRMRSGLPVVRMELNRNISDGFLKQLTKCFKTDDAHICCDRTSFGIKYVGELTALLSENVSLRFPRYTPCPPKGLRREGSIIRRIQRRDRLLFYPYDSIEPFLRLLREASERPDVLSIQITVYRLAPDSEIARILCRAAENGKNVLVVMELRARFDEENNLFWSERMEAAGCRVIYGDGRYKCHSKVCLITLKSEGKKGYITQIGTGNYNEATALTYTDLSLLTASEEIGADADAFFRGLTERRGRPVCRHLLTAPQGLKKALYRMIDEEAAKGKNGYICIKTNAVTEREIIDRLRAASAAGATVDLIVRSICCIRPGIPKQTENIRVTSIVGRFLEHARIYCFGKGRNAKLYISSADLMTRNLKRRIETACPIYDPAVREQLLHILAVQLADTGKARIMLPDGTYRRKDTSGNPTDSQQRFMEEALI